MMKIIYLSIPFGLLLLSGCCASNHSSKMKEILEPIQKELVSFHKKNNHYPTKDERNTLLEKLGCKISKDKCKYLGESFSIHSESNERNEYDLSFILENSRCYVGLFKDGDSKGVSCNQDSCLGLKQ